MSAFIKAIKQQNLAAIKAILEKKSRQGRKHLIDSEYEEGFNSLAHACIKNDLNIVNLLLSKGADVNGKNKDQETALIVGSLYGHREVVSTLLKHGADVKAKKKDNRTALMHASQNGHTDVVCLLLQHDADVNAVDDNQWTSLMMASENGHNEVSVTLIDHGADVTAVNKNQWTALMIASKNGHNEVVCTLVEHGPDTNAAEVDQWTALMIAAQNGHKDIVCTLIEHGADVTVRDKNQWTALMFASQNGHKEVVSTLIEHGADVNAAEVDKWTALMIASQNGHKDMVSTLIEHGADVNAVEIDQWTALMFASQNGHKEVVYTLIEHGADVNAISVKQLTALMFASQNGHKEVVYSLITHGADANAVNSNQGTALMLASQDGHKESVSLLLEYGVDVNTKSSNFRTALMIVSQNNYKELCEMLIEYGADVNTADKDQRTALMFAASKNGQKEILDVLIEHGADVNATDKDNSTAIVKASRYGHKDIVTTLIQHGADINILNKDQHTALMIASNNGQKEIANMIQAHAEHINVKNKSKASVITQENGHEKILIDEAEVDRSSWTKSIDLSTVLDSQHKVTEALVTSEAEAIESKNNQATIDLTTVSKNEHNMATNKLVSQEADVDTSNRNQLKTVISDNSYNAVDIQKPNVSNLKKCTVDAQVHCDSTKSIGKSPETWRITASGGLYIFKPDDIIVSIPYNINSSTSSIYLQSRHIHTFEEGTFEGMDVCSDIITLMPHQSVFDKHILLRFPLKSPKPFATFTLMYSDSETEDEYHWVPLRQNAFSTKHSDSIFWFNDERYCYVFTQLFCHIVMVEQSGHEEKTLFLSMSLHGKWNSKRLDQLSLVVSFCCKKCQEQHPAFRAHEFGALITMTGKRVYQKCGPLQVLIRLMEGDWHQREISKDVDIDDLLLLCHDDADDKDIHDVPFCFIPRGPKLDDDVQILGTVVAKQQNHTPSDIDFVESLSQLKQEQRTPSPSGEQQPRESLPMRNEDIDRRIFQVIQQNITQQHCSTAIYLNPQYSYLRRLPMQAEECDPVFNLSVESEQELLCSILDRDAKASLGNIALKVGGINGHIQGRNLTVLSLLQFWKMHVISGKHTWRQFYDILLELNCNRAAQQFKIVYEKDMLITRIDDLKLTLPLRDILTELVQESIITVGESIELSGMGNPEHATVDFVWKKLLRRGHNVITKFHKVLWRRQFCAELVKVLVLCPEDMTEVAQS